MIAPSFINNGAERDRPELDRRFSFLYRAHGAWHEEIVTAKNYAMACCILGFRHGRRFQSEGALPGDFVIDLGKESEC